MKKFYHVFTLVLLLVGTGVLINFVSNANSKYVKDSAGNVHNAQTKDYAIFPSEIIENSPTDINKYIHYKRNIEIKFPQLYFSNDYSEYDIDIETQINELLFALSIENDISFLIGRDTREIKEYCSNYTITKCNVDIFSIKYFGHLYSISHAREFCYGITINAKTGEAAKISDFVSINESLIEDLEKGDIKYYSTPMYNKAFVTDVVAEFVDNYSISPYNKNSFFINGDSVNLIVPVFQGNSNYIILEVPYGP